MAVQRRLAAILAADVAGYSRLMGEDEEGTLATLTAHLSELIEPCIAEHRGRPRWTMAPSPDRSNTTRRRRSPSPASCDPSRRSSAPKWTLWARRRAPCRGDRRRTGLPYGSDS